MHWIWRIIIPFFIKNKKINNLRNYTIFNIIVKIQNKIKMPVHPISFSVPAENIVDHVPQKEKMVAGCHYDSRAFHDENEYFKEYQRSLFGNTKCKAGWDCNRHYEILANGCIPNFENMDKIPRNTMVDFPKDIVKRGMKLTSLDRAEYEPIVKELLDYTRENLTTEARVKYILSKLGKKVEDVKNVLYLGDSVHGDYLRCTILHGFKKIFKEKCVDMIRVPHIYDSYPPEIRHQIHGFGFSYAFRIPAEYDIKCDRMNIGERIASHDFDVIIYGSIHRGLPLLDHVLKTYKEDEIAFLCGEDFHECPFLRNGLADKHHLFIREL
jgi:hypothetical protein